jgi:hypothetical protein
MRMSLFLLHNVSSTHLPATSFHLDQTLLPFVYFPLDIHQPTCYTMHKATNRRFAFIAYLVFLATKTKNRSCLTYRGTSIQKATKMRVSSVSKSQPTNRPAKIHVPSVALSQTKKQPPCSSPSPSQKPPVSTVPSVSTNRPAKIHISNVALPQTKTAYILLLIDTSSSGE